MCAYVLDERDNTAFETDYPENYTGEQYSRLTIKAGRAAAKQQAIERLRELLPPGTTVHTILRNVSRSGMMRHIDCYKSTAEGMIYLSGMIATALDLRQTDNGALKVSGCGMDMGFHIVYNLGSVLYGKFYNGAGWRCIGDKCPSNEHSGLCYGKPRNGQDTHEDGGYALNQTWL